jgi:hypothetical protein
MEQPGLGDRLPFRGPTCGQATLRAVRGLPRAWRSPAASLLRMSRRPGPAAVSGSPAARRVACPGTYWQPRQAAGGSFLRQGPRCQGPGEVDVGAGFRQLLLGLLRRLRAGDVDRTSAPRMADRAVDQGTLRVDALDPCPAEAHSSGGVAVVSRSKCESQAAARCLSFRTRPSILRQAAAAPPSAPGRIQAWSIVRQEYPELVDLAARPRLTRRLGSRTKSAIRRWGGTSAVLRSVVNGGYCLGSVSA